MTREDYIYYPALSASRIKQYYSGDLTRIHGALSKGASFHQRLLEVSPAMMDKEAKSVYSSILASPIGKAIFSDASFEVPQVSQVSILGRVIPAKAMHDIKNDKVGIIADVKTTSCKNILDFKDDMMAHYNHIQAVWFSMVAGISPDKFYYIGVNIKARNGIVDPNAIMYYRHTDAEIEIAKSLINQYIRTQWDQVEQAVCNRYKEAQ
jgi:hypothetical protein